MVSINLLPWREQRLQHRKKILKRIPVAAMLCAGVIIMISHLILSHYESVMHERINIISEKINGLRQVSAPQSDTVSHLQRSKNIILMGKLFSKFEKMNQPKSCFTEIEETDNAVSFTGKAKSVNDLTEFMLHWNAATLFNKIEMKLIEQEDNGYVRFEFEAEK
jgi:Tfp pilus assembly protein PilN